MTFLERTVNGQPGLVAQQDGVTVTVFAFDVAGDRIKHIWVSTQPREAPALDDGLTPYRTGNGHTGNWLNPGCGRRPVG